MKAALTVQRLGARRYQVSGGAHPHVVDLSVDPPTCDCADHQFRQRRCKHIDAAEQYRRPIPPELRAIKDELAALRAQLATMPPLEARARLEILASWLWRARQSLTPLEHPGRRWWHQARAAS